jgi:hypothetical protein
MTTKERATSKEPDSTRQLKAIFEQSLDMLSESESTATTTELKSRARRAALPLYLDPVNLQKRALDDAAKALATLWNISKPQRPRLPARALPCVR